MVVVSGYNVYPREIEELLCACDGVQEAAVIGLPDARRGEQVYAFVGARPGVQLNSDKLRDYCAANLVHYKVPSVIEVRDALPRTSVGKIDKKALATG
jgi:long-chain acyl-CoA synthetase